MANFIGVVFATLKKQGIDTKNMSTDEAIAKFNEINGKDGGSNTKGEEPPKQEPKTAETGKKDTENSDKRQGLELVKNVQNTGDFKADSKELDGRYNKYNELNKDIYQSIKQELGINGKPNQVQVRNAVKKLQDKTNGKANSWDYNMLIKEIGADQAQLQNAMMYIDMNKSKLQNAMGITPDEAKAFASGNGHLSKDGGYNGVSNIKDAPTFEYKATEKYSGDKARFNNLYSGLEKGWGERAINEELTNIGFNEGAVQNFNSIRKTLQLDNEKSIEMLASMFNVSHNRK